MKNKKKFLLAAILILTIVSIGSYAIYKSTATGTSGFKTAKWYIELNDQDITTTNTFTFDLKAADWTHNAIIDSDETELVVIAPGSYGTFGIELDATETEVDVAYEITAVVKQNDTVVELSTINPNLSLGFYENDTLKSNPLTGSIAAHGTYNGEIRIVWDAVDSASSNSQDININDQDFVIEVTVVTKQKAKPKTAAETISSVQGLVDVAGAKRYAESNPNNYVDFNGETWRIIGVYGNNVKIIRDEALSNRKEFYNYASKNNWDESDLKTYLNGDYYNSLNDTAKNLIAEGTWNVGSVEYSSNASEAYQSAQQSTWEGKVGLLASYEYLYAGSSSCYEIEGPSYGTCSDNNWLKPTDPIWTLSQVSNSSINIISIWGSGSIQMSGANVLAYVRPVLYLDSTVTITGGTGAPDNHYTLG